MKISFANALFLIVLLIISFGFSSIYEDEKIHLKITKQENGEKTVFERTYTTIDDMKADEELKAFDVLVKDWTDDHSKGIIVKKSLDGDEKLGSVSENEEIHTDDTHIISKKKVAGEENTQGEGKKVIKIKIDEEENVFTMTSDGENEHKMSWIDEDGNKTEITEENIEEILKEDSAGEKVEIKKEIKVMNCGELDEKNKIIIMSGDPDDVAEIEVKVEKEVDENGNELIREKKVWITKDGKKVEPEDGDAFEVKTEGEKMTIEIDKKNIHIADFSDGEFEGENSMVFQSENGHDAGAKHTININIEEKNGEQFIEIDIKRNSTLNVTISDILENDETLHDVKVDLKNNLEPSLLNYFPNPNNGKFNLKFNLGKREDVSIKVMDILGNEVYKEKILDFNGAYDNEINLIGKEKGIYILQINQKKKALTRKILIE